MDPPAANLGAMGQRIVVAMSGGVDSSVAAALLQAEGYEVIGVTLKLQECEQARGSRSCCGVDGLVRARAVAGQLGIRHYVLDCVTEFEQSVLHPAWEEYARGRTPSPCLLCNERIKFGLLLSWSRAIGASHVATGHYARIERDADGSPALLRGLDRAKDQSYFLAGLGAEQLRSVLFPLGSLTKQKVRSLAASLKLPCATTRDSQGACLVREGQTFAEMLRLRFGASARPGVIIDDEGSVIGRHQGIHLFTVGQRHGIPIHSNLTTWVKRIEPGLDAITVTHDPNGLMSHVLATSDVVWVRPAPSGEKIKCLVQVRYRTAPAECLLQELGSDRARAIFVEPLSAVAPGQAAVFYEGQRALGRGWIDASE